MTDNSTTALAAGLVGGYLLGRTKKTKIALALATYAAGRALGSPRERVMSGLRTVAEQAGLTGLGDQLREEVSRAGRAAATEAAERRLGTLAETLQARTKALRGPEASGNGSEEPGEPDEPEEPEDAAEPEKTEKPRRSQQRPTAGSRKGG
ncbi:hypothetical protein [Streptomyces sp. 7-21]|jgi:hypothetical protein|uniref:hypothetical protein n=1 Tax=Streptomyces sp. 7-21 TaxID=2802283 RepID=UPI00191C9FA2|nr:hypothetical protein [Streptomyces sp. 7-21]MBL1065638.1 hypothetical protein [Streptomyces sp. 7-21]